jgi:hypothetical protein
MIVARAALRSLSVAIALLLAACNDTPQRQPPAGPAPDSFRVAFATSKGTFVVEPKYHLIATPNQLSITAP